jgi:pentose-5-phosphate-3-epimerase
MSGAQISASILNADFSALGRDVKRAAAAGVDSTSRITPT